jgi:hypothetical protein
MMTACGRFPFSNIANLRASGATDEQAAAEPLLILHDPMPVAVLADAE